MIKMYTRLHIWGVLRGKYCICIRTRGEIYSKIWPYFTIYADSSPNTDIIPFLTMIY